MIKENGLHDCHATLSMIIANRNCVRRCYEDHQRLLKIEYNANHFTFKALVNFCPLCGFASRRPKDIDKISANNPTIDKQF